MNFDLLGKAVASAAAFIRFRTNAFARRRLFAHWSGAKEWQPEVPGVSRGHRSKRRKAVIAASMRCGHARRRGRREQYARPLLREGFKETDFKGRLWAARRVNA